jgi:hypothetical protein
MAEAVTFLLTFLARPFRTLACTLPVPAYIFCGFTQWVQTDASMRRLVGPRPPVSASFSIYGRPTIL